MYGGSRIVDVGSADGRSPAVRKAEVEYAQWGGQLVQDGALVRLWDHRRNRHVLCRCVVVSIGKGPVVKPEKRKPAARRVEQDGATKAALELARWMLRVGQVTADQAAERMGVKKATATAMLKAHADLFEARKIARTIFYRARGS